MPPRKSQTRTSVTSSRGGRTTRARPNSRDVSQDPAQSPVASEEAATPTSQPTSQPPTEGSPAPMSLAEFKAWVKSAPMSVQIQRYKDWKRNGSNHETTCRVCSRGGTLEPCHTCRLAFHSDCVSLSRHVSPDGSTASYCSVCIERGWHRSPPALTPPASPVLRPTDQQITLATTGQAPATSSAISIPNLVSQTLGPDAGQQPSPRSLQQWHRDTVEDIRLLNTLSESITVPKRPRETLTSTDGQSNIETPTQKRQRKSRFATLSNEVEGALSVLYRELESVTSLKLQIEELQSQKRQDAQLIKLRDNDIAIMRRDLEQRRSAVLELAQLRASMSQSGDLKREVDELRARNAVLEKELEESKAQTAAAREMVNTWKGKLSQLLDA
ncbi:hypothetical protein BJX68DRAFT_270115 [Aspergillus pseudodeflectus]|uniref:Zinc finger PHD-type domain-containing protein n=1 Tax=Aspergillus pseudodeflectus TaxID=176178 RepID=A0ABR4JU97_9EURO